MNKWDKLRQEIEQEIDNPRSTLGKVALSFVLAKMSTLDKEEQRVCESCRIVFVPFNPDDVLCKLCKSIKGRQTNEK
jgi:hypothetical protein